MRYFLIIFLLFLSIKVSSQEKAEPKKVQFPVGYSKQINLVYKVVRDWNGKMDIYFNASKKEPMPLVINIHGGGWNTGSKEMDNWFGSYFKRGFAVANINYRLAGTASAPAAIEDVRCAITYLVDKAKELNIDPNRIVLCGTSAGGHLALLAGVLGNDTLFSGGCKIPKPHKVVAIIDKWGISDVHEWGFGVKGPGNNAVKRWLGPKADDIELAKKLSPINYINKATPPVFIVHGDADAIVPVTHATLLHQKLKDSGVKTELFIIPEGKHGNFGKAFNEQINDRLTDFLKSIHL